MNCTHKDHELRSPCRGSAETNPIVSMRMQIRSLASISVSGSGFAVSCGVGHRHGSDPVLLWRRLRAAAPIRPLGWEPPYGAGAAIKTKKLI